MDDDVSSLASRVTELRKKKGVSNLSSGLDLFEIPTLFIHKAQATTTSTAQRQLNEPHVKELMVSCCAFTFLIRNVIIS